MNSLEFIEELINNIETNIYITESVLKTYDDSDDEEEINTLKNNLEYLKERLKYSKQIKNELEAWEIVKFAIDCENLAEGRLRIKYGDNNFMGLCGDEIRTLAKAMGGSYE